MLTTPGLAIVKSGFITEFIMYHPHLNILVLNRKPRAIIMPAKAVLGSRLAPRVAAFSSKGPNSLTAEILKVCSTGDRFLRVLVFEV